MLCLEFLSSLFLDLSLVPELFFEYGGVLDLDRVLERFLLYLDFEGFFASLALTLHLSSCKALSTTLALPELISGVFFLLSFLW